MRSFALRWLYRQFKLLQGFRMGASQGNIILQFGFYCQEIYIIHKRKIERKEEKRKE